MGEELGIPIYGASKSRCSVASESGGLFFIIGVVSLRSEFARIGPCAFRFKQKKLQTLDEQLGQVS